MRQLKIDLSELEMAFDNSFVELSYYLDTETGQVLMGRDDESEVRPVLILVTNTSRGTADDCAFQPILRLIPIHLEEDIFNTGAGAIRVMSKIGSYW